MESKRLNIIQNNIQSIRPLEKREELYACMKKNDVDIAILQEIWLKRSENFQMKDFELISKCREEGYGGVGVLVRQGLNYQVLKTPEIFPIEMVGITIKLNKGNLKIMNVISIYLPPGGSLNTELKSKFERLFSFLENLTGEIVVGADLNAHHVSWSPMFDNCARGNLIYQLVIESKLIMMNDGAATKLTPIGGRDSAIDLSLATAGIAQQCNWAVKEESFESPHFVIAMEIGGAFPIASGKRKKINQQKVVDSINSIRPQYIYNPDEMVGIFEEAVEKASYVVDNKKANYLKRWWSEEIEESYKQKREVLKEYNKSRSQTNYIRLQKIRAEFKKIVRRTKRKYVQELMELVDETTPSRQLWNIIKGIDSALMGKNRKISEMEFDEGQLKTHSN
ncbi:uncharacterized protein LOC129745417 isoform X1 [Uranotaenia lowii]|uniref:uncharacterized protein LOC129745417 isoform X1 n=1 Tax=Uranotaenia lowii TaxID=190385 RepID=UPI002478F5F0|nr:uncharacterized protein LOC129745417 isoform X1 [Uranotaenia lowii]